MSEPPVLQYMEIYSHGFKSSEGRIDGWTERGFEYVFDSVHEYIEKYMDFAYHHRRHLVLEALGYTTTWVGDNYDFDIDFDDCGESLSDRENNEDGFWYEGRGSGCKEYYLNVEGPRGHPRRSLSEASVIASTDTELLKEDDPTTRRILMLLKLIGQARRRIRRGEDEDSLLLEVVRYWLVEEARDLRGIQLEQFSAADVGSLNLTGVRYDDKTTWPAGFDPAAAGAVSA